MPPGVEQWVWVCDFHGFGMADINPKLAKAFLDISAEHYPEVGEVGARLLCCTTGTRQAGRGMADRAVCSLCSGVASGWLCVVHLRSVKSLATVGLHPTTLKWTGDWNMRSKKPVHHIVRSAPDEHLHRAEGLMSSFLSFPHSMHITCQRL